MNTSSLRPVVSCLFALLVVPALASAQTMLHDIAKKKQLYPGAPLYSDVAMRSQYAYYGAAAGVSKAAKDLNNNRIIDVEKVIEIGKKVHITRVDWSYIPDLGIPENDRRNIINTIKNQGWKFGASLNSATYNTDATLIDRNGNKRITPIYKFSPGRYTGCVNNPRFQAEFSTEVANVLKFAPDSIQMDDTEANFSTTRWIDPTTGLLYTSSEQGCFCSYCRNKAVERGLDILNNSQKMLDFQENSVMEFYDEFLGLCIGDIPLSTNGEEVTNISADPFDYNLSERTAWGASRPIIYWDVARKMQGENSSLTYSAQDDLTSLDSNSVNLTNGWRYNIGLAYANGINFMLPWDQFLVQYIATGERYWVAPGDLADIYGFVRANAHFLDGYEDAVITGFGGFTTISNNIDTATWQMKENRYNNEDPLQIDNDTASSRISGFGRAIPGDADAPKVVHLVDYWKSGATPRSHQIRLRVPNYFPIPVGTTVDKAITVRLHRPRVAYDETAHDLAENSKNYAALCEVVPLTVASELDGINASVTISGNASGIDPWGFLVVEKGGIQGHWSFDDNGGDYSPNRLNMSLTNGADYSNESRYSSKSLILDGINDYATTPDDAKLDMRTGDFSFAAWFYRESSDTVNLRVLSKGGASSTDTGYALWGSNTQISASVSNGQTRLILTAPHNGAGKWTHVAVNVNRTSSPYTIEMFIDGVSKTTTVADTLSSVDINSSKALDIGRDVSGLYWKGRIDDVRIYNRLLSKSEIKLLARKSL